MGCLTFPTRRALVGAAAILTVISMVAWLWNVFGGDYTKWWLSEAPIGPCHGETIVAFASVLIAIPPALWLVKVAESPHIQAAAAYTLLNWGAVLSDFMRQVANCQAPSFFPGHPFSITERRLLKRPGLFFAVCVASFGFFLVVTRLQALERASLRGFSTRWQRRLFGAATTVLCLQVAAWSVNRMMQGSHPVVFGLLYTALLLALLLMGLGYLLLVLSLWRAFRAAQAARKAAGPRLAPWARSVQSAMALQILAMLMSLITTVPSGLVRLPAVWHQTLGLDELGESFAIVTLLDMVANNLLALAISGVFSGAAEGTARRSRLVRERRQRREKATERWLGRRGGLGEEEREWEAQVEELARRGMTISALLHFYKVELPRWMPDFQSSQHTTGDVARFAIIPLSESQECAAAEILMGRAPARPAKMVTHAWSSHFRDLVASILADAFSEGEYWLWAELLDRDFACVEKWVEVAGVGEHAYWICAFAVNQHASICHAERVDSITGQVFPGCPCNKAKLLNDTPPLMTDGRSIPCQLNKFDDMIRFLAATGEFAQMVAVDRKFATFTRSWCIAELATSHEIGLAQHLTILSKAKLEEHEEMLQRLRIQDMYATRSEDKDLILAAIADHDIFNATLQKMIFEDLLPRWNSLDAKERMASAGLLIRWGGSPVWGAAEEATTQVATPTPPA